MFRCRSLTEWKLSRSFGKKKKILLAYPDNSQVTAYALKGDRENPLSQGMDEYISKNQSTFMN